MRPRACRIEKERLALLGAGAIEVVVDPEMDDADAIRIEAEELDRAVPDERADDDHAVGSANGAVPGEMSERPLAA